MTNGINQNFKAAIHLMVLNHQVLKLHMTHSTSNRGGYEQKNIFKSSRNQTQTQLEIPFSLSNGCFRDIMKLVLHRDFIWGLHVV